MLSKIVSTMVSDSLRGSYVMRRTSSMRSAFVNVKLGCLVIVSLPRRAVVVQTPHPVARSVLTLLRESKRLTGGWP